MYNQVNFLSSLSLSSLSREVTVDVIRETPGVTDMGGARSPGGGGGGGQND